MGYADTRFGTRLFRLSGCNIAVNRAWNDSCGGPQYRGEGSCSCPSRRVRLVLHGRDKVARASCTSCCLLLLWKRALPTELKALGNTQEMTDKLFLACSPGLLAQWEEHASTKIYCVWREINDSRPAFSGTLLHSCLNRHLRLSLESKKAFGGWLVSADYFS